MCAVPGRVDDHSDCCRRSCGVVVALAMRVEALWSAHRLPHFGYDCGSYRRAVVYVRSGGKGRPLIRVK